MLIDYLIMKLEQAVVVLIFCSCLVVVNTSADGETQGMSPSKIIVFCLIAMTCNHVYIISAMSTVELTSSIDKSGRLAVCCNETIVYTCRIAINPTQSVLTWNSTPQAIRALFAVNDSKYRFVADNVLGKYYVTYLQNNGATDNYLLSDLVIPYIPELTGTQVQCISGLVSKNLTYVVTGE